jgi:hypothetical protein
LPSFSLWQLSQNLSVRPLCIVIVIHECGAAERLQMRRFNTLTSRRNVFEFREQCEQRATKVHRQFRIFGVVGMLVDKLEFESIKSNQSLRLVTQTLSTSTSPTLRCPGDRPADAGIPLQPQCTLPTSHVSRNRCHHSAVHCVGLRSVCAWRRERPSF